MKISNAKAQELREKKSLISPNLVYEGRVIQLQLDTYEINGRPKTFEIIHHPGAVVIVPVRDDGHLLLVQQWRRAIHRIITELPAGTLEKNEDPLACAERELQEEIGFRSKKMNSLKGFYSAPGFCDEYLHLFLAEDLTPSKLPQDDDEGIDVIALSLDAALQWIEEEKIVDAKSIAGILRYALWRKER